MKKILDDDLVNNILDIRVYQKGNTINYINPVLTGVSIYSTIEAMLIALKMNRGISNITIPFIFIIAFVNSYKQKKNSIKKLKLYKKQLKGKINLLNNYNILINENDLVNAIILKGESSENVKTTNIYISNNDTVNILKQETYLDKTNHVFLLSNTEKEKYIKNNPELQGIINNNEIKKRSKKIRISKYNPNMYFILALFNILLLFPSTIKKEINNVLYDRPKTEKYWIILIIKIV